ncbi:MAG: alpha/beta hydrolase-fold protein, partial [Candidatus Kariarchaeaceae archaeon]
MDLLRFKQKKVLGFALIFVLISTLSGFFIVKEINYRNRTDCRDYSFDSKQMQASIQIKLSLPDGFKSNPDKEYNTIYLLDAAYFFEEIGSLDTLFGDSRKGGMKTILQSLIDNETVKPSVLVGIKYDETVRNRYVINNAAQLYSFFELELIPDIESRCRVSTSAEDRTIIGYSSSAHFTTY